MPKQISPNSLITSRELIDQSEALRQQAEALKKEEIPGVVERIKVAIAHYGLTAADLGFGSSGAPAGGRQRKPAAKGGRSRKSTKAADKAPKVVKFQDGAGNTWSGRGRAPAWFKDALTAGASQESLLA